MPSEPQVVAPAASGWARWLAGVGRWLGTATLALLIAQTLLLAWVWVEAWRSGGLTDEGTWGFPGWRPSPDLREAWQLSAGLHCSALILALWSLVLQPGRRGAWILAAVFATTVLSLVTLGLLTD